MNPLSKVLLLSVAAVASASSSLRGSPSDHHHRSLAGSPDNQRIIGGTEADEGRYSYAVSLQDDYGHFCGGALITPNVVLSAAHCASNCGSSCDGEYKVVINRHDLRTDDGEEIEIDVELVHPDYNEDTTDNDFMLLFLKNNVTSPDVELVHVSSDIIPENIDVTVVGWGDTDITDKQDLADKLMEVEVRTVTNADCDASSSTEPGWEDNYHDQITDNMICAEHADEKDACQGDSGGPLVVRSTTGGQDSIIGVVSWGVGCAHDDFPGVYARVSAQFGWIEQHICMRKSLGSSPPPDFDCSPYVEYTTITATTTTVATTSPPGDDSWKTIVQEDFLTGFGLFGQNGNDAKHYPGEVADRQGVVRIADGQDGISDFSSLTIPLNGEYSKLSIHFSYFPILMEEQDELCVEYFLDADITGNRCWSTDSMINGWNDDVGLEFDATDANSVWFRFRVGGDDDNDDVLLDSVTVRGKTIAMPQI